MESNWRYNVAVAGWQLGPYGLIARRLDIAGLAITNRPAFGGGFEVLAEDPVPGHLWLPFGVHTPSGGQTSFPYGLPVEPD